MGIEMFRTKEEKRQLFLDAMSEKILILHACVLNASALNECLLDFATLPLYDLIYRVVNKDNVIVVANITNV